MPSPTADPAASAALPAAAVRGGARPLRAWQQAALEDVMARGGGAYLASATPAAGKTAFGLAVAGALLAARRVARIVVVAPTTHICRQWAGAAASLGIDLEPNRPNAAGAEPRDRRGVAVTYATIASGPRVHARACAARPTLLIADEPHHMGELAAWGLGAGEAFDTAHLRLLLSGTPFRSDDTAIPWVTYDSNGLSRPDYAYSYTDALLDAVCRPITFLAYDGEMEWVSDGRQRTAGFEVALPRDEGARRLRTALDADGEWIGAVLRDADARLGELRAGDHPTAGGLVVAADKAHATLLARRLERLAGEPVEVVTSDEPDASRRIDAFAAGTRRWLVSVLMVSEGVDIPRLRVGVYATAARTELFFRQVVGRFVRRTPTPARQMSYLFMPADPQLKALAATIEDERRHALELGAAEPEDERLATERTGEGAGFVALSSSAHLDDVIRSTTRPGDALQLFADPSAPPPPVAPAPPPLPDDGDALAGLPAHERRERLRAERSRLVAQLARGTGEPHRTINARANRAAGIRAVADATDAQLRTCNEALARELARTRR